VLYAYVQTFDVTDGKTGQTTSLNFSNRAFYLFEGGFATANSGIYSNGGFVFFLFSYFG